MKTKIIGILVVTLLIATALPAVGTMNNDEAFKEKSNDYNKLIHPSNDARSNPGEGLETDELTAFEGEDDVIIANTDAGRGLSASLILFSYGTLSTGQEYASYDLQVTVTGGDAWTVAGGDPWAIVTGGTFYQDPNHDYVPPDPWYPDSEFTSFYTTHLCYPNTADACVSPGFAYGPYDTPTTLNAYWFWTPDGNFYPGTFTIARLTVLPDSPEWCWCLEINVEIGSINVAPFEWNTEFRSCLGDIDLDSDVDLADLAILLSNYGTTSGMSYWDGDLDGDDDVDLSDLAELLAMYGTSC